MKQDNSFVAAGAAVLLALLPSSTWSQGVEGSDPGGIPSGPEIVRIEDVVLEQYEPRYVDAHELYELALGTVGRSIYLAERGGLSGPPVSTISLLGERVVVADRSGYARAVLERLQALDRPAQSRPELGAITVEYTPGYVTASMARQALEPLSRRDPSGASNVILAQDRNVLILHDREERVAEMQDVLRSIDRPEPQAFLTCYLVQGGAEDDPAGLPAALHESLRAMLPEFGFKSIGFAMLRTSVAPGRSVQLRIEGKGPSYELGFRPVAWQAESGALTVQSCELVRQSDERHRIFATNTVLNSGEYTVLGATGSQPVFLVVKLDQVR